MYTVLQGTNMEDALTKAYLIAKLGEKRFKDSANTPKPIIVFLTDGEPTTGITEPQELIKYVSNTNEEKWVNNFYCIPIGYN